MNRLDHYLRGEIYKPFDEPWHAEVFAVTVHLSERNLFSWTEWTEALGNQISKVKLRRAIDGSNDYYNLWLQALIEIISNKGITDAEAIVGLGCLLRPGWSGAHGSARRQADAEVPADERPEVDDVRPRREQRDGNEELRDLVPRPRHAYRVLRPDA